MPLAERASPGTNDSTDVNGGVSLRSAIAAANFDAADGAAGTITFAAGLDGEQIKVTHDTAVEVLLGGAGDDLFFAKLTNPAKDTLGDKGANESAV